MTGTDGHDHRPGATNADAPDGAVTDGGDDRRDDRPGEDGNGNDDDDGAGPETGDEDGNETGTRTADPNDAPPHRLGSPAAGDDGLPLEAIERLEYRYELASGESVVDAVLTVVAGVQECDPLELPPLYEAIDPTTLESTWNENAPGSAGLNRAVWCTFVLDRTLVTVTSAGSIYAAEFAAEGSATGEPSA